MKKIKDFVIKYQLWIKLIAIALLVCVIFTPYIYIDDLLHDYGKDKTLFDCSPVSFFHIIINKRIGLDDKYFLSPNGYGEFPAYNVLAWIVFCLTTITIILLILSIFKPKTTIFATTLYNIGFIFILIASIYSIYAYKHCILFNRYTTVSLYITLNISFYLSVLLFIFNVIVQILIFIPKLKHISRKPTKRERIEELEKRITELEEQHKGG